VLRAAMAYPDLAIVAVNDLADPDTLAYLVEYNSVHGRFNRPVAANDGGLGVDGRPVRVFHETDPARIPWGEAGAEIVIEATGRFENQADAAKHLRGGARRVIITAPAKEVRTTLVLGVNHRIFDPARDDVIGMGSCTTHALAPVAKVLHERFGLRKAFVNTTHAYTNSQALLDRPGANPRRSRSAATNLVPSTTRSVQALGDVIPDLRGRVSGVAVRVPVPDGSLLDLTGLLDRDVTVDEINRAMREAAAGDELSRYLAVTDRPIVSSDVIGVDQSAVVDLTLTEAMGSFVKVFAWYDNEWSFALRVCDLARYVAAK
jgi:glyceraldehyde 3-phosphate dehydrogenase